MKPFNIEITSIEKGPEELELQLPIKAKAIKELPGKDRPDYILASLESSILWVNKEKGINKEIDFVVLCAKFKGQSINSDMKGMTVAVAYVIDNSIEQDVMLNFRKCKYVAVAKATATSKWNIFN
ncbi:hypothetical protein A8B79_07675 [Balneola sp. EhC07]|jgi:hypothetical protein|uniref:hypothetical protein n=1 Tax=Balneola sp. EhC07 TaxID=1849360 RepID=UPI0007F49B34|nr:hypothetical protein [Balneola sp. EhC07]OAN61329.1 hypothetical protein A8B79_07675 [Balneola sp. EhC07]